MPRRYPAIPPCRARRTGHGCRGCAPFRPAGNQEASAPGRQPCPRSPARTQTKATTTWPVVRSEGSGQDWRARALRLRLPPADEALRHRIGDRGRIATGFRAFGPDLLEPDRNAVNAAAHETGVAVVQILGADIDDAASVDDIIRGIEDAAGVKALAVFGRRQLIVGAAGDDRRLQGSDRLLGQDCPERIGTDDVGLKAED